MSKSIQVNISSLFKISFPLMLSVLSTHGMMFIDRVILARYDLNALNAASASIMTVSVLQYGAMGVTAISEVFVGRHNGAKEFAAIGTAVWQMIWFAVILFVLSIPIALYGSKIIVPQELSFYGVPYFKWIMAFSPLAAISTGLSGFYIGIGLTRYIILSVVLANIVNIFLDLILVFGIKGFVPSLGIRGAAIATIIGSFMQCILLFYGFLNGKNRILYGTAKWYLKPIVMWQEMKLGIPQGLGHTIEIAAWAFTFYFIAPLGMTFITVLTVCHSFMLTVYFMIEGLQTGITGIAANLIGARRIDQIKILLNSSLKLYTVILFIIAIPMLIFAKQLVTSVFISNHNAIELINQVTIGLQWMFVFCIFDGLVWIIAGIMIAGGDTKFVMVFNSVNTWLFSIAPLYFLAKTNFIEPYMMSLFMVLYALINAGFFVARYRSGKWQRFSVNWGTCPQITENPVTVLCE